MERRCESEEGDESSDLVKEKKGSDVSQRSCPQCIGVLVKELRESAVEAFNARLGGCLRCFVGISSRKRLAQESRPALRRPEEHLSEHVGRDRFQICYVILQLWTASALRRRSAL